MKIEQVAKSQRVAIRDRTPVARGLKAAYNRAKSEAWEAAGEHFDNEMVMDRFTEAHAKRAGYYARKGQNLPMDSKGFRNSYYGRKYYAENRGGGPRQALPLVDSGETRDAVQSQGGRISTTRFGAKIAYAAARKLNFRNPRSRIRMNEEFRRLTPQEIQALADLFDRELDRRWK